MNNESKIMRALSKLVDLYVVGFLWFAFCIPVVTAGAATSALYYTCHKAIKGNRDYVWRSFWRQFKDHLGDSIKGTLIFELLMGVLIADCFILRDVMLSGSKYGGLYYFFLILQVLLLVCFFWTYCYRARFEQNWKLSMKNGILLTFAHLPWSILIMLCMILCFGIGWYIFVNLVMIPILPLIPGIMFLIFDAIMERAFRRYMSEEELAQELELEMEQKDL